MKIAPPIKSVLYQVQFMQRMLMNDRSENWFESRRALPVYIHGIRLNKRILTQS
ncbi:hypothetical protein YC2023_070922 [Brassica napus]